MIVKNLSKTALAVNVVVSVCTRLPSAEVSDTLWHKCLLPMRIVAHLLLMCECASFKTLNSTVLATRTGAYKGGANKEGSLIVRLQVFQFLFEYNSYSSDCQSMDVQYIYTQLAHNQLVNFHHIRGLD